MLAPQTLTAETALLSGERDTRTARLAQQRSLEMGRTLFLAQLSATVGIHTTQALGTAPGRHGKAVQTMICSSGLLRMQSSCVPAAELTGGGSCVVGWKAES